MLLDHQSLEPFEPLIQELVDSAFGDALRGLAAAGFRAGDEWHTEAGLVFRAACIPAFRRTQQRVGTLVLDLERQIARLESDEAKARAERKTLTSEVRELRAVLENRQLVLRRLMDAILWVLVLPNWWLLRRLRVDGGIRRIDTATLEPLLTAVAGHETKRDETVSVICDLTTTAQLGDLVIAMWLPSRNVMKMVVAELKVGKVNILLRERLQRSSDLESGDEIRKISAELGRRAAKQAERIVRQERRLKNFDRVIATDIGADPVSGRPFKMTRHVISKDYRDKLSALVARARSEGWSGLTLDRCLHLIARRYEPNADQQKGLKIAHDFYHLRYGRYCAANGSEADKSAEAVAIKNAPLAVNLFDFCMRQSLAMPPLLWYPRDAMLDVLAGRIEVFAQFDYEEFFQLARRWAGIELEFVIGKRARRIKAAKISGPLIEYRDDRFVLARKPPMPTMLFGARFFGRLYMSLMRPRDVLRGLIATMTEAARDQERAGRASAAVADSKDDGKEKAS
jgi:hypothetical protein